jgi:hypothetical protein
MDKIKEFKSLIDQKAKRQIPVQTEWVKVESVNWEDKTMVAIGEANDLPYEDVLLGLGSIYKKPKPGSLALIGLINNSAGCYIIDCEAYDEIEVNAKLTTLQVKDKGVRIKKGDEDLLEIMNDFNDEVLKVFTQNGMAFEAPKFAAFKLRLNSVLTSE